MSALAPVLAIAMTLQAAPQQAPPAPPQPAPTRGLEAPRLAPTRADNARSNYLRELEESERRTAAQAEADRLAAEGEVPADPGQDENSAAQPATQPPSDADRPAGLLMAPSPQSQTAAGTAVVVPAAAPTAPMSPTLTIALSVLAAFAMLAGPAIGAAWLFGHPVPPPAE